MRTQSLVAALVAGIVLAGCSKPEPAAGAPAPDVVTVDSAKAVDSATTTADSTATAAKDSMTKDSATTPVPDSAAKP